MSSGEDVVMGTGAGAGAGPAVIRMLSGDKRRIEEITPEGQESPIKVGAMGQGPTPTGKQTPTINEFSTQAKLQMGYHLYADVHHDFDSAGPPFYNTGAGNVDALFKNEDDTVRYFREQSIATDLFRERDARLSSKIVFTVPAKTGTFQTWSPPVLWAGGNGEIGIVQDAGEKITLPLGAQNVLTFGSILDPAGKPNKQPDAPIWYNPGRNATVTIPLDMFGFEPTVIRAIEIHDLTAGLVKAAFVVPNNAGGVVRWDAVSMRKLTDGGPPQGQKPLNQTESADAGFFTSIAGANTVSILGRTQQADGPPDYFFKIGKTLGDAMLVASCMSNYAGTPNPFYGVGADAGWRSWLGNNPPVERSPPQTLVLKTGDRLNHLRANLLGVGSILEQQASKQRATKQYEYIPAVVSDDAIRASIRRGYDKMIEDATTRYNDLASSFLRCIVGSGSGAPGLVDGATSFTGEEVVKSNLGKTRVVALLQEIANSLAVVRDEVVGWIRARPGYVEMVGAGTMSVDKLRGEYNSDAEVLTRMVPSTTEVLYTKGRPAQTMMKIKIVVRQGSPLYPTLPPLDISLWNAFRKLNDTTPKLNGTDFYNRYYSRVQYGWSPAVQAFFPQAGGQRGGVRQFSWEDEHREGIDPEETTLFTELATTLGEPTAEPKSEVTGGAYSQTGGAQLVQIPDNLDLKTIIESQFPNTWSYITFLMSTTVEDDLGLNFDDSIDQLYRVVAQSDDDLVLDPDVLNIIREEWIPSVREGEDTDVSMDEGPGTEQRGEYRSVISEYVTFRAIDGIRYDAFLMFNLYTCQLNIQNALTFGFDTRVSVVSDTSAPRIDENTYLVKYFTELQDALAKHKNWEITRLRGRGVLRPAIVSRTTRERAMGVRGTGVGAIDPDMPPLERVIDPEAALRAMEKVDGGGKRTGGRRPLYG